MTKEEAKNKYGSHGDCFIDEGYVYCLKCPVGDEQCHLLHGENTDKNPTGYGDCWEHIANVMTEREAENTKQETESAVDHPSHYAGEKYECIEVMREVFGDEVVKAFCLGNAFKYLWRCKKKHKSPYEDIAKAIWYFEKHNSIEEGEKENGKQQTESSAEGA